MYNDYEDAMYDAEEDLRNAEMQDYNDAHQEGKTQEEEWLQSEEYLKLLHLVKEDYYEEKGYAESYMHEREEYVQDAPYRHGTEQYIARNALKTYVDELNASCNVTFCNCEHSNFDYSFGPHGEPYWTGDFVEFCICYEDHIPKDSPLMIKLRELENNYKISKEKLNIDMSPHYKELDDIEKKYDALLQKIKTRPT